GLDTARSGVELRMTDRGLTVVTGRTDRGRRLSETARRVALGAVLERSRKTTARESVRGSAEAVDDVRRSGLDEAGKVTAPVDLVDHDLEVDRRGWPVACRPDRSIGSGRVVAHDAILRLADAVVAVERELTVAAVAIFDIDCRSGRCRSSAREIDVG